MPPVNNMKRLSIVMVLDGLREQCDALSLARSKVSAMVEERNETMRELKAAGIPESTIARITGLGPDSVHKITGGARKAAALDVERFVSTGKPITSRDLWS